MDKDKALGLFERSAKRVLTTLLEDHVRSIMGGSGRPIQRSIARAIKSSEAAALKLHERLRAADNERIARAKAEFETVFGALNGEGNENSSH